MPGAPDTWKHRARWFTPVVHRLEVKPFDATEPPPTVPAKHELDRAANVVFHHIAEQCHHADTTGNYRPMARIRDLVSLDLGSERLDPTGLYILIETWPLGGEFPTQDAADAYEHETRTWLMCHGWGQRRAA